MGIGLKNLTITRWHIDGKHKMNKITIDSHFWGNKTFDNLVFSNQPYYANTHNELTLRIINLLGICTDVWET